MKRAPARTAVPTPTPAMLAPEWRLRDLRSAHIVDLPTPHRRTWFSLLAVFLAGGTIVVAQLAVSEEPVYWIAVVVLALATYGYVVAVREVSAQLRCPPKASFEELTEWEETGGDALDGVAKVVLEGSAGLLDSALGFAGELSTGLWRRRKPRQVARWQARSSVDLLTGERRLVTCPAVLAPHGLRRPLLWLSFGLILLFNYGWLTVTDQRLLFHRRSWFRRWRAPYVAHLSAPLAELELREWYKGQYLEASQHVLIMRCSDGRIVRLNIHRIWAEEAQLVFDVAASCSTRLPAFLAARWTLSPPDGPTT